MTAHTYFRTFSNGLTCHMVVIMNGLTPTYDIEWHPDCPSADQEIEIAAEYQRWRSWVHRHLISFVFNRRCAAQVFHAAVCG